MVKNEKTGLWDLFKSFVGHVLNPDFEQKLKTLSEQLEIPEDSEIDDILTALTDDLRKAESPQAHDEARLKIIGLMNQIVAWQTTAEQLMDQVEELRAEWLTKERFTERGWESVKNDIGAQFERSESRGASRWLEELVATLDAREFEATERVLTEPFPFPEYVEPTLGRLRKSLLEDAENDVIDTLLDLTEQETFERWDTRLSKSARGKLHLLMAWMIASPARSNDLDLKDAEIERVLYHFARAAEIDPGSGQVYAERAGLYLLMGDLERSAADAQRSIDMSPDDAAGFLQLGAWAEAVQHWDEANEHYLVGINQMVPGTVHTIVPSRTFMEPTGNLLTVAAGVLHDQDADDEALNLIEEALNLGINGPQEFPEAKVYALQKEVLKALKRPAEEVAAAAFEAGKRYSWNGEYLDAERLLNEARKTRQAPTETGWYLADAQRLLVANHPSVYPDKLATAKNIWHEWDRDYGPPQGRLSWPLLSRAYIEVLEVGGDNWIALTYAERAIMHQADDPLRWVLVSETVSNLGMFRVGLEAADRALDINPDHGGGLDLKSVNLTGLGRYEEALEVIRHKEKLEPQFFYGASYAWIYLRLGKPELAFEVLGEGVTEDHYNYLYYLRELADVLLALGEIEEARSKFEIIANLDYYRRNDLFSVALAKIVIGEFEEAGQLIEKSRELSAINSGDEHFYRAQLALFGNDPEKAEHELRLAVEQANTEQLDELEHFAALYLPLASESADRHRLQDLVENTLSEALSGAKRQLDANQLNTEAQIDEAVEKQTGDNAQTALGAMRARRYGEQNDWFQAAQLYNNLFDAEIFKPEASIGLRRASEELRITGDLEVLEKVLAFTVDRAIYSKSHAGLLLARAYEDAGQTEQALVRYQAIAADPVGSVDSVESGILRGDLLLAKRDFDDAYQAFNMAREEASRQALGYQSDELSIRTAVASALAQRTDTRDSVENALAALKRLYGSDDETILIPTDLVPDSLSQIVNQDSIDGISKLLSTPDTPESLSPDALDHAVKMFGNVLTDKN